VGPNVDSERGVVGLRLVADKLPEFILPNMTIDVNIEVQRTDNAIALPASAVSFQGRPHVLAVVGGKLEPLMVTVLGKNPEWVAVDGIAVDATVLRAVRDGKPGQRVRPVAPAAAGPPNAGPPSRS
jgi:multidrug efflux pump subunit AcrA (membrane-fusion protein)